MEPLELVAGLTKVSDQIRVLSAAGHTIAQIEKLLGKRYQHVRGVVRTATPEQMRQAQAHLRNLRGDPPISGVEEEPAMWTGPPAFMGNQLGQGEVRRLVLRADGALVLPPALMAELDLQPGGGVIVRLENGTLTLTSPQENLRRLQERVARYLPLDAPSLADELIADRRREAAKEQDRG